MKKLHFCFYVPWYGEVEFLSFIVPIKCESNVSFYFPEFHYLIVLFKYTYEVVGMFFNLVLSSKDVKFQGEIDLLPSVFP